MWSRFKPPPGRRVKGRNIGTPPPMSYDEYMRSAQHAYLARLVLACGGNMSDAARAAGRNRTDFYKLIHRAGVDVAQLRELCGCETGFHGATKPEVRMAKQLFDTAFRAFVRCRLPQESRA